ncbi:MAG: hypothetical protein AAFQ82_03345, partial [Myxococcota bacterium]
MRPTLPALSSLIVFYSTGAFAAPVPAVDCPSEIDAFIGENTSVTFSLSNSSANPADAGFGPFIDFVVPVNGADGIAGVDTDGLSLTGVSGFGSSVAAQTVVFPDDGIGCVDHPIAEDDFGVPSEVCGTPGDQLVVVELPFGSYVPDQPAADVTVSFDISDFADGATPLPIRHRGGFLYGANPLDDPCCDPTLFSETLTDSSQWPAVAVTPALMLISKTYNGPEDETSTGPNFPRTYTIAVDIADGQTVNNLDLTEAFPPEMAFLRVVSENVSSTAISTPSVGVANSAPNNELVRRYDSVTGGAGNDIVLTVEFFIPRDSANSSLVLNATTGDDVLSENDVLALGDWEPNDPRDVGATDNAQAGAGETEHTLSLRSIAVQESVAIVSDLGSSGLSPNDVLEYTVEVQISDFFAFNELLLSSTLSDGQRFDSSFVPTLVFDEHGSQSSAPFDPASFALSTDFDPDPLPNAGTTTITFDLSAERTARQALDRFLGGCVPTSGVALPDCSAFDAGATTL